MILIITLVESANDRIYAVIKNLRNLRVRYPIMNVFDKKYELSLFLLRANMPRANRRRYVSHVDNYHVSGREKEGLCSWMLAEVCTFVGAIDDNTGGVQ